MHEPPIILNPTGLFPGLIVVDHAGVDVPARFGGLGLSDDWRETHHFCDLGVAPLARLLADQLDAVVVLSTVSRLVIDLNRWLDDPRSILTEAEGVGIPGNMALSRAHWQARQDHIFWPYHITVAQLWHKIAQAHRAPVFFALHSCTRHFDGARRPWDGGTIWHESPALAHDLLDGLDGSGLTLGDNQPYSGQGGVFTLDRHTWGRGQRACGFEVSNDLLETAGDIDHWAALLGQALCRAVTERHDA